MIRKGLTQIQLLTNQFQFKFLKNFLLTGDPMVTLRRSTTLLSNSNICIHKTTILHLKPPKILFLL